MLRWGTGRKLYHLTFKTHHLWHIADNSRFLNPRFTWCYGAEDFMCVIVTTGRASVAGTPMEGIGSKLIESSCLVMELVLLDAVV